VKKEISSKSPLVGVTALGRKAMPSMMRYVEAPLTNLDIRLLKGFYVSDKVELMNDQEKTEMKEDMANKRLQFHTNTHIHSRSYVPKNREPAFDT
jgi:hypothetical protein